ncbi:MAG: hypothetical protein ACREBE_05730 [bacterium]
MTEQLLRGGVAPKHVRRTIDELQSHHADLVAEAQSRGRSLDEAALEASARLGDEDALAAEIIARPELRSWTHRWPWVAYCMTPVAAFVAGFVGLSILRWASPASPRILAGGLRLLQIFGLPLFLGGLSCLVAGRRRAALRWPVLGVTIVSFLGAALQLDICWPHGPNAPRAICMAVTVLPPFIDHSSALLRTLTSCLLIFGPYLWWRMSRRNTTVEILSSHD